MALPNFLVIGAQRCGTTTLHGLLSQHEDVFVPRHVKEPHYFDQDRNYANGLFYYERVFFSECRDQRAVGEVTPSYMYSGETLLRIRQDLGQPKIIISLRHPVDRAYSQYRMNYSLFWENEPFLDVLEKEPGRLAERVSPLRYAYAARGRYAEQVRKAMEVFGAENVLVLIFEEDLAPDVQIAADRVFAFLGVAPRKVQAVHANRTQFPVVQRFERPTMLQARVAGVSAPQQIVAPAGSVLIQGGWGAAVTLTERPSAAFLDTLSRWELNQAGEKPDSDQRRRLMDRYFRDDVEALERLLGRSLAVWE